MTSPFRFESLKADLMDGHFNFSHEGGILLHKPKNSSMFFHYILIKTHHFIEDEGILLLKIVQKPKLVQYILTRWSHSTP